MTVIHTNFVQQTYYSMNFYHRQTILEANPPPYENLTMEFSTPSETY